MANQPSLQELACRTGCIVDANTIVFLLEDPALANQDTPHTCLAIWQKGRDWYRGSLDYDGIAAVVVPGEAGVSRQLIIVGSTGKFTVISGGSAINGVIKDEDALASANYVHGSVIAVGILGRIYRMLNPSAWDVLTNTSIKTNIESCCEYPAGGFLVCGWQGLVALYDGSTVERLESGTNVILTSIICGEEGEIIACGQKGTIVRGHRDSLNRLELSGIMDDFWSIVKFQGEIYVSSITALYKLIDEETLELVKLEGDVVLTSFYHLDTYGDSLMLSVGQKDAGIFDGKDWARIL